MTNPSQSLANFPLGRLCYAPHADDVKAVAKAGLAPWLDSQFAAGAADDPDTAARLKSFKLPIKYPAGDNSVEGGGALRTWPAVDELRPLQYIDAPSDKAAALFEPKMDGDRKLVIPGPEHQRPYDEVVMATILRAVHSRWQLRETLAAFWHDHFNVLVEDWRVVAALPSYDRDVIRAHALGNFRDMLEAVASSPAMLFYLSNWTSRAGSANENYGRELMELHTLGRSAYLNDRYDRWREVPGALEGKPIGYIDEDVYEAARAFTGWTVEFGQKLDSQTELPHSGHFRYVESWHDGYQKRVLGTDFEPFAAPLADGRKVLDLTAFHPATARFLAFKLCRRLVSDDPPQNLIDSTAKVWLETAKRKDQIALVVRHIVQSKEFEASAGAKVRSPLALVASFARAADIDLLPNAALANQLALAGQKLFGWAAPDGRPDTAAYYITPEAMRQRWFIVQRLAINAGGTGMPRALELASRVPWRPREVAGAWLARFGANAGDAEKLALAFGINPDATVPAGDKRLIQLVGYCAMAPAFNMT